MQNTKKKILRYIGLRSPEILTFFSSDSARTRVVADVNSRTRSGNDGRAGADVHLLLLLLPLLLFLVGAWLGFRCVPASKQSTRLFTGFVYVRVHIFQKKRTTAQLVELIADVFDSSFFTV